MLLEVWSISVTILAVTYILRSGNIEAKMVMESLLPTTFAANWYMTCYLLFYLLHPTLNEIIGRMSQKELLRTASLLAVLYIGFNFIKSSFFFSLCHHHMGCNILCCGIHKAILKRFCIQCNDKYLCDAYCLSGTYWTHFYNEPVRIADQRIF